MENANSRRKNLLYISKVLWRYDRWIFLFFLLSVLLNSLTPYVLILAPKSILNAILDHVELDSLMRLFIAILIVGLLIYTLSDVFQHQYSTRINTARNGCFGDMLTSKMMEMRYALLEMPEIQELCFRANMLFWDESSGIAGVFDGLMKILANILTSIGLAGILFGLNPSLPFVLALSIMGNTILISRSRKIENEYRPLIGKIMREKGYLDDMMRDPVASKDIRLFGMADWLMRWYKRITKSRVGITEELQKRKIKYDMLVLAITVVREMVLYGYLISSVIHKTIRIDDFILYTATSISFTAALIAIIDNSSRIRQFLQHTDDFRGAMQLETVQSKQSSATALSFDYIDIKNACFRYPNSEKNALSMLNLQIKKGERVAIVGANGSGKTTLVKLLVGLYRPDKGVVAFCNADGTRSNTANHSFSFSLVLQKIFQYAFTLAENITFTTHRFQDMDRLNKAVILSGMQEDVNSFPNGLQTILRKEFDPGGITLSGGQMQKLAIARAVYHDAPVIVLDEPTASLDALSELSFYESFDKIFAQKTCIFISHRLSSVLFCDKIVLIDNGQIVDCGSHDELYRRSALYTAMWDAQSKPYQEEFAP